MEIRLDTMFLFIRPSRPANNDGKLMKMAAPSYEEIHFLNYNK